MTSNLIIVVVDDHDFQRRTMMRMLRTMGVRDVREAADGKQALVLTRSGQVDVVICDLDMPEMDGMELIRHLGEEGHVGGVIIVSAQEPSLLASVQRMAEAYGVRLLGVIPKPATLAGLKGLITPYAPLPPQPGRDAGDANALSLDDILRGLHREEFIPFFQPQLDLASGRIVGAEGLARWRSPEHGLIAPHAFISRLEQSGDIDALTFQMLVKSANACRRWHTRGLIATVSVNLSLVSLHDPDVVNRITEVVHSAGITPKQVILEITESTAMTDIASALEKLNRLRMRGFGLSIDDYGTGFSSIQQLMRIPFTELKIDRGFVTDCATNPSARMVVETCVEMARRMNIKSVAEGVETEAEWNALKIIGCDMAQGYYIAKPMDEKQLLQFASDRCETTPGEPRDGMEESHHGPQDQR